MGDIFDAIAEDYGCGGCGEIISPLIWKKCKLIGDKRYHPGCEPGIRESSIYHCGACNHDRDKHVKNVDGYIICVVHRCTCWNWSTKSQGRK